MASRKRLDVPVILRDFNVPVITEGDKHCGPGWMQTHCPFCDEGRDKYHMGYNLRRDYWNCWSCGWHPAGEVLDALTGKTEHELRLLYPPMRPQHTTEPRKAPEPRRERELHLPEGTGPLNTRHRAYLTDRGYDAARIEGLYGLKGTGPIGRYKFRIIAPIWHDKRLVSYQGRDITGRAPLPYKACPKALELRDHKHCLYGAELVGGTSVVVVEGITDAWRLGRGAVATFGIEYTPTQVHLLAQYKHVMILYDQEPTAQKQARKLMAAIAALGGTRVEVVEEERMASDPAAMPQADADALMRELIFNGTRA